jgi:hypothetical protein
MASCRLTSKRTRELLKSNKTFADLRTVSLQVALRLVTATAACRKLILFIIFIQLSSPLQRAWGKCSSMWKITGQQGHYIRFRNHPRERPRMCKQYLSEILCRPIKYEDHSWPKPTTHQLLEHAHNEFLGDLFPKLQNGFVEQI